MRLASSDALVGAVPSARTTSRRVGSASAANTASRRTALVDAVGRSGTRVAARTRARARSEPCGPRLPLRLDQRLADAQHAATAVFAVVVIVVVDHELDRGGRVGAR